MNASGFHSRKPPDSTENDWSQMAGLPDLVRKTLEELGILSARQAPCPTVTSLSIRSPSKKPAVGFMRESTRNSPSSERWALLR
jgi:hypothetical protein